MSRSGYSEDYDGDDYGIANLYAANIRRALDGKRGQAFLHEMAAALDAMPEKRLIANDIVRSDGACCALGSVAIARGKSSADLVDVAPEDGKRVARFFGIAECLAREVEYENDDNGPWCGDETPEQRWVRMRAWVEKNLRKEAT